MCVYIYISLFYVLLHFLSLSFLTFFIFLSPVETEFLIGIDILVARAVIIGMRNGRNFLTSTSPAESRRIASIFAILALFVSARYLSAKRGRKVFGNSSRYSRWTRIIIIISRIEVSKRGNTGKPVTVIEARKKSLGVSELLRFRIIEHLVPHDCKNRYFH